MIYDTDETKKDVVLAIGFAFSLGMIGLIASFYSISFRLIPIIRSNGNILP